MTHLADATSTFYATGETERKAIEQAVETITRELIGTVGADITEEDNKDETTTPPGMTRSPIK